MERRFTKHVFMTAWRRMSLALLLLVLTTTTTWAQVPVEINGIWYELNQASNTATVINKEGGYSGIINIPQYVIYQEYPPFIVTSIGDNAFSGCLNLAFVNIPASVIFIGDGAFNGCPNLTDINVDPENSYYSSPFGGVLFNKEGTVLVRYPAGKTTEDGYYLIPDNVTVGPNAFEGVTYPIYYTNANGDISGEQFKHLGRIDYDPNKVYVSGSVVNVEGIDFYPEGTEITLAPVGDNIFSSVPTVFNVSDPEGLVAVDVQTYTFTMPAYDVNVLVDLTPTRGTFGENDALDWAMSDENQDGTLEKLTISGTGDMDGCPWEPLKSGITTVVIGDGVTSISNSAFYGCPNLTSVSIPASVTSIGECAFEGCASLTTVSIPASVTSIGESAFEGCTSLTTVSIPASVTSVGSYAFENTPWLDDQPDGVVYVGKVAYQWIDKYNNFTSIVIADGTVSISPWAFAGAQITSVSIPASVTSIGDYAFNACPNLTSVIIPASVTSIGNYAFQSCTKLEYVYVLPTTPPTIGYDPFNACNALTAIVVPAAAYDTYYNDNVTGWNSYQLQLKKNIANCTATVPDQTLGRFNPATNSYYKTNKISYLFGDLTAFIGEEVIDGETKLTLGTDYEFGTISYASPDTRDYWDVGNDKVGDVCEVEIVGMGNYAGSTTATFTIVDPSGKWGDDNELSWSLNEGALSISLTTPANGNKAMKAADNYGKYPWNYYCSDVTSISIGDGITSIANYAFGGQNNTNTYSNVTTVTLPSTLTSIGAEAFRGCSGATITIPTSVTTLGNDPFSNVAKVICTLNDNNSDFYSKLTTATSAEITYKRTFTENVASTVCLPFDYTPQGEGTYYTFTEINKTTSPWTVTMTSTAASLTANTPYMFMPATTGEVTFVGTASNFTYDLTGADVDDPDVTDGKWNLIGTYATKQWDGTHNTGEIGSVYGFAAQNYDGSSYTVNPGDFVKAMAGASIAPFRAYLKYTAPVSNAPRRGTAEETLPSRMTVRLVNADGDVTAIGTIDTKTGEIRFDSEAWYTLDGRKLNAKPTQKGMYIVNGKKVIVK